MQTPALGHLVRVNARDVWSHEALGFTPWLRQNIGELAAVLGLDLDMEAEVSVGSFAVDLAGKDLGSGRTVIIENQLEPTDHGHLGQLLVYASGLDAAIIVWVSPKFRDEHREAIDWLNRHTDEDLYFFGLELELLRIGESLPAPNFKLVAQPNEWAKETKQAATSGPSDRARRYQRFFDEVLAEFKAQRPGVTNAARVAPQNWFTFSAGRTGFGFSWSFAGDGQLRSELYIDTGDREINKAMFDKLYEERDRLEAALGLGVSWERLENRKASRIALYTNVPDAPPLDENSELKQWAVASMVRLNDVLRPVIKTL